MDNLYNLNKKKKGLAVYSGMIGCTISASARDAVALATELKKPIILDFNGIEMEVQPNGDFRAIEKEYNVRSDEQRQEYLKSPEHKAYLVKREKQIKATNAKIDALMATFDPRSLDVLIPWIKELAKVADDVDSNLDKKALLKNLEAAGYETGGFCGLDKNLYETDKNVMGRYIVGQVMSCLKSGMPPHPVAMRFCDDYMAMK